jgi:hypothetical protein
MEINTLEEYTILYTENKMSCGLSKQQKTNKLQEQSPQPNYTD